MNILYKYCDCLGGIKILSSLELKLPFISDVNDPYDCRALYVCGDDKGKIEKWFLKTLDKRNLPVPNDFKLKVDDFLKSEDRRTELIVKAHKVHEDWNKENCLLSVSKTAKNPVIWAHYADLHQGVVIGIDFDIVFYKDGKTWGIQMNEVIYPPERQKIDVFDDDKGRYLKILTTKSFYWGYEEEVRCIFAKNSTDAPGTDLETSQRDGLMLFKEFNGKKTWFLRLNPQSIKQVIFGLSTEESLKLAVRKLIVGLPDIKLYKVVESKTYQFDMVEL